MAFGSINFFLFIPAVFFIFYVLQDKYRWIFLLLSSFFFYFTLQQPFLIGILLLVSVITYWTGLKIGEGREEKDKKKFLWLGVGLNLILLIVIKCSFLVKFPLPSIGVSYFIFQAISYLIDIELEKIESEKHFGYFLLYMCFFPKLLQGPIERGENLLPQLKAPYVFNYENTRDGLILFAWGLFKKIVIADNLAPYVNRVYNDVDSFIGLSLIFATYFFAIQLYADFSGYTDMALGTARLFNIRLSRNFQRPYFASSVAEFWRGWHISLSGWLMDYVFKPLQFEFRNWKEYGNALAVMIVFLVCGVWHGVGWTFLVWGGLHGIYMAVAILLSKTRKNIYKKFNLNKNKIWYIFCVLFTFHLICFGWIFFRANNMGDALYTVTHLFSGWGSQLGHPGAIFREMGMKDVKLTLLPILLLLIVELLQIKGSVMSRVTALHPVLRWSLYVMLIVYIIYFGAFGNEDFIYFQF